MSTKLIDGIVLSDFVEILLGNSRWMYCPAYIAAKLATVDKDMQYVFVEIPNELNELDRPKVWNIKDWKDSDERLQKRRRLSELENNVHTFATECRLWGVKYLANLTGLPPDNMQDAAARVVKSRNIFGMRNIKIPLGLIDNLLIADKELNQYRKEIGMK